nr:tail protein [Methylobacterium sp. ZNC0032]
MQQLTLTTELDAINLMLAGIGESPVNTVESNGVVDAVLARQQLRATMRRVQERGWHWNTDPDLVLPRTFPDGFINVPANTLKVDTTRPDQDVDVVQRGTRLYDRRKHSYSFDRALTVNLVSLLPFDEMPEAGRQFVALSAARKFQEDRVGSGDASAFNRRDELIAWSSLCDAEAETRGYNVLTESASVAGVLDR